MILANKTVVITGVGGGLGRECATSALRDGANVVLAARTEETLATIANELDPSGQRVATQVCDITDEASCVALAEAATARFGTIDALVQVAAFENAWGGIDDYKPDTWKSAFDTNVLGALNVIKPVVGVMKEHGGGAVVLIGSQSMFAPSMPQGGYAASKSALLSAMYYLADELGPHNIRFNMVIPSWMWGPPVEMLVNWRSTNEERTKDEVLHDIVGKFPLRRMTEDGEVADVVSFFASDHAKAVTGQYLLVNSGEIFR